MLTHDDHDDNSSLFVDIAMLAIKVLSSKITKASFPLFLSQSASVASRLTALSLYINFKFIYLFRTKSYSIVQNKTIRSK